MDQLPHKDDEALQKAERIAYLIAGHLQDNLSPAEREELDEWVGASDENLALFEKLTDEEQIELEMHRFRNRESSKAEALEGIKRKLGLRPVKTWLHLLAPWMLAAAVVLIAVSIYLFKTGDSEKNTTKHPAPSVEGTVQPGKEQAVLILADGRTLILDATQSGTVAEEGALKIRKLTNEALVYENNGTTTGFHTLSVPRGGQYQLLLDDGTRVWLNAESSLYYPVSFTGSERKVVLRGEGYFEVAKQAQKPFVVSFLKDGGEAGSVKVLGTQFNINAYQSETAVRATLVEGSVQVTSNGVSKILKPGELAQITHRIQVSPTDVDEEVAWKEGKFLFRDATIQTIGEQIRRWYNVDVRYKGTISQHFNAEIGRDAPLSRLLQILERTGQVHFELEGTTLTIQP